MVICVTVHVYDSFSIVTVHRHSQVYCYVKEPDCCKTALLKLHYCLLLLAVVIFYAGP